MRPQKRIILLLAIAAGIAAWVFFSLSAPKNVKFYGNVDQRQIDLAFIDAERIAEVLVEEGAEVKQGQVLARLETRRLRDKIAVLEAQAATARADLARLQNGTRPEEIAQAKAVVESAEAEVEFAAQQYKRYSEIWKKSRELAVSKQDVEETRLKLNVTRAKLRQSKESLRLAEIGPRWEDIAAAEAVLLARERDLEDMRNRLADADLKSPCASVVRSRLLEPGDMATPQRAVFSLAVISPKWIRAYISEPDLGRIRQGMKAQIYTDSHKDQPVTGTVGFISSVAEFTPKAVQTEDLRTSLVYEMRVYVEDRDDLLRLGMPATVMFPDGLE